MEFKFLGSQLYFDEQFEKIIHSDYMNEILSYFDMPEVVKRSNSLDEFEQEHPEYVDRFDGYIAYYFCDADKGPESIKERISHIYPDISYGIGVASKEGLQHRHEESDAYNKIIAGHGIFTGQNSVFDGQELKPGVELEIPMNMLHGHQVVGNEPIVFLFVQGCGFFKGNACDGDFHLYNNS